MRELAIDLVRQCAERVLRDGDAAPDTARWYRRWFDGEYERWLHTPRPELGGVAPLTAIADERSRLGIAGGGPNGTPNSLELYTDLPQLEPWPDAANRDAALAPPWSAEPAMAPPDQAASPSAVDEARWQRFCADHLAGWLEP
jgi:hypothetical protein